MDTETVRWLSSLGVGGIIAGFMFIFYRRDRLAAMEETKNYIKQLEEHSQIVREDRKLLMDLLRNTSETVLKLSSSIDANTAAVTWLIRSPNTK